MKFFAVIAALCAATAAQSAECPSTMYAEVFKGHGCKGPSKKDHPKPKDFKMMNGGCHHGRTMSCSATGFHMAAYKDMKC